MLRPLIVQAEAACRHALEEIGFDWRSGRLVVDVNEEVVGFCSVSRVPHRAERLVTVSPVVAVTHLPLEMALSEVRGERPPSRYKSKPPLVRPIGYLMPARKYTTWRFSEDVNPDEVARELADAVANYGLPFIRQHRTLEDFYESMVTRRYGGLAEDFGYRLPLAALKLGRLESVPKHLSDYLDRLGGRNDGWAREYRTFAERIAEQLTAPDRAMVLQAIERSRSTPPEPTIIGEHAPELLSEVIDEWGRANNMSVNWDASTSTWSLRSEDAGVTRQVDVTLRHEPPRVAATPYAFRDDAETSTRYYFRGPGRAYGVHLPVRPSQLHDLLVRTTKLAFSLTEADLKGTSPLGS